MQTIQITNQVPVKSSYDVIVAGGGVAGAAAALAARRRSLKVLLIEKTTLLGGLATSGLVNLFVPMCNGRGRKIIGGMVDEFIAISTRYGYDVTPESWRGGVCAPDSDSRYFVRFSANIFALALTEALTSEGVDLLFDSVVSEPVMRDGVCRGLVVENKSGREFYAARVVIDTTGDADVLYRAGVPTVQGGNYDTYYSFCATLDSCAAALKSRNIRDISQWRTGGHANLYGKGHPEGMPLYTGTTAQSVTEYLVHNQIELLNHIKGDDRMTRDIVTLPTMCQFRTTRHIDGEYTLTEDDAYRHFEDSVGAICDFDRRDYLYEVPFGTLVHRDFPNLITAGRTAAGQGYAWDVLRVIPPAIVTGQAAGEAAVLAVETGSAIAAVNLEELQRRLVAGGMPLHFDDALIPQEESGSDRQEDIGHI